MHIALDPSAGMSSSLVVACLPQVASLSRQRVTDQPIGLLLSPEAPIMTPTAIHCLDTFPCPSVTGRCGVCVQATQFVEEMASILLTPFVLYYSLPDCTDAILEFVRDHTVFVEGVGDICSLANFDFDKHGNSKYGAITHCPKVIIATAICQFSHQQIST